MKLVTAILSVAACAVLAPRVSAQATAVTMARLVPFADSGAVRKAVLDECKLSEQQASGLKTESAAVGITLTLDDDAAKAGKGRVLILEITDAGGRGNAFTGQSRSVSEKGRLLEDGKEIGNFNAARTSGGGAFGAYKGACAVLNRDVATLSKDIAKWLKSPTKDARLGELK
jgi:hypothetical protein